MAVVSVDVKPTCEAIEENLILEYTPSVTSLDMLSQAFFNDFYNILHCR